MNISLGDTKSWKGQNQYLIDDVVIFQGNYYFCIKQNRGVDPKQGLNTLWIKDSKFIWEPSYLSSTNPRLALKYSNFIPVAGATNVEKAKANNHLLILNLKFTLRSDLQTKAILSFLELKRGYKSFDFFMGQPYNKLIKCRCRQFSHSYIFKDNNEISTNFEEIA